MKIKVCGLKDFLNIKEISESDADFVGIIFYEKSPRFVNGSLSFDQAREINTKKVGVFVNESAYSVLSKVAHYNLDVVQLHGNESPDYCRELKRNVKIMKAFGVDVDFDFQILEAYEKCVDYFLFDTATLNYGGSGKTFDYTLLAKYNFSIPFFISGGISIGTVQTLKQLNIKHLYGVDINSKFEISPGLKDVIKVKQFIKELK